MEHGGVDCRWRRLTCADWMNSVKIVGMMLIPVPSKEQREKEALTVWSRLTCAREMDVADQLRV